LRVGDFRFRRDEIWNTRSDVSRAEVAEAESIVKSIKPAS
jgi:hypothetical protein